MTRGSSAMDVGSVGETHRPSLALEGGLLEDCERVDMCVGGAVHKWE